MSEKLVCEACGKLFDPEDKVVVELYENEMIICQGCGRILTNYLLGLTTCQEDQNDTWDE